MPQLDADLSQLLVRGRSIDFEAVAGEVVGNRKWAETHVTSTGGGGVVGGYGGIVTAPSIRSRTVTKSEIWLRDTAGQEHPIQFTGLDIPVREGHQVTAVGATPDGKSRRQVVLICNRTTGQFLVNHRALVSMATKLGFFGVLMGLAALPSFFLALAGNILFAVISGGIALYLTTIWKKHKADMDLMRGHIDKIRVAIGIPERAAGV